MINVKTKDPIDVRPDDELEVRTDLKRGDIITVERIARNRVAIMALSKEELAEFIGKTYQIDRDSTPDQIKLTLVEYAEAPV